MLTKSTRPSAGPRRSFSRCRSKRSIFGEESDIERKLIQNSRGVVRIYGGQKSVARPFDCPQVTRSNKPRNSSYCKVFCHEALNLPCII